MYWTTPFWTFFFHREIVTAPAAEFVELLVNYGDVPNVNDVFVDLASITYVMIDIPSLIDAKLHEP